MDPGMEHAISALRMPSRIGGPPERRWPALKTRLSARIHVRAGTLEPRTSNKKTTKSRSGPIGVYSSGLAIRLAALSPSRLDFLRFSLARFYGWSVPLGMVPPTFLCQMI